ncbi:MAG: AAA family ATPase [Kurthia gibsonii]
MINKVIIKNYKSYEDFELNLNPDLNIIIGDNEAGKSALLRSCNFSIN